jgi:hypothetical protein
MEKSPDCKSALVRVYRQPFQNPYQHHFPNQLPHPYPNQYRHQHLFLFLLLLPMLSLIITIGTIITTDTITIGQTMPGGGGHSSSMGRVSFPCRSTSARRSSSGAAQPQREGRHRFRVDRVLHPQAVQRQPPKATARNRIAVPFDLTFAGSTSNICYGVAGVVARAFKCQAGPPKS